MLFPGKRVLIVEDEMLIVMALEDMLTDLGAIPVAQACSVSEGLALVEKGQFDVAILDINLRGTKVFPVAEALEASGKPYIFGVATVKVKSCRNLQSIQFWSNLTRRTSLFRP